MSKMRILQEADCSGRILASLLIAWVTIAMVASILLEWNYMWIVLMVLTLLFLFICGYTAYNVKKTNARILIEQQRRAAIRTISSITAANRREVFYDIYVELIIFRNIYLVQIVCTFYKRVKF